MLEDAAPPPPSSPWTTQHCRFTSLLFTQQLQSSCITSFTRSLFSRLCSWERAATYRTRFHWFLIISLKHFSVTSYKRWRRHTGDVPSSSNVRISTVLPSPPLSFMAGSGYVISLSFGHARWIQSRVVTWSTCWMLTCHKGRLTSLLHFNDYEFLRSSSLSEGEGLTPVFSSTDTRLWKHSFQIKLNSN